MWFFSYCLILRINEFEYFDKPLISSLSILTSFKELSWTLSIIYLFCSFVSCINCWCASTSMFKSFLIERKPNNRTKEILRNYLNHSYFQILINKSPPAVIILSFTYIPSLTPNLWISFTSSILFKDSYSHTFILLSICVAVFGWMRSTASFRRSGSMGLTIYPMELYSQALIANSS